MAIGGTGSNADGIGARVYVTTGAKDNGGPRIQVQEVRAGSSYLSMDSVELEFGVGASGVIDEIEILWPSGVRQILEEVAVDRQIVVTEPEN